MTLFRIRFLFAATLVLTICTQTKPALPSPNAERRAPCNYATPPPHHPTQNRPRREPEPLTITNRVAEWQSCRGDTPMAAYLTRSPSPPRPSERGT
jgi:hypothetical protein